MQRYSQAKVAPGAAQATLDLERFLHGCGLEESLLHLIKLRASQINGCAYCLPGTQKRFSRRPQNASSRLRFLRRFWF
jgi:alkylhydroperoxidase family enzyme